MIKVPEYPSAPHTNMSLSRSKLLSGNSTQPVVIGHQNHSLFALKWSTQPAPTITIRILLHIKIQEHGGFLQAPFVVSSNDIGM